MDFNVYGRKIKVNKIKNLIEHHNAVGQYDPVTTQIIVDSRLSGRDLLLTYLHELIHATCHRLGYANTQLSMDMEEMICDNIPEMILENFDVKVKCKKKNAK